ncbi:MAG: hypothetical protein AB8G16_11395 [Gammaproteobacteria bacterium]
METSQEKIRASGVSVGFVAALILTLLCGSALAKEKPWYKYESQYFVAYSNASKRKTQGILDNLEMFRQAALQVAAMDLPDGAPKSRIMIFRNDGEFQDAVGSPKASGFVIRNSEEFLMTLPARRSNVRSQRVLRYEFSHVLLSYQMRNHPKWYRVGFAELLSTIRFRNKNREFVLGEAPEGTELVDGYGFSWNTLIDEGFTLDGQRIGKTHSAYLQSWLLVHYALLGDNFSNAEKLSTYLNLVARGQESLGAFQTAFGMDGEDLWRAELRPYSQRMSSLVYDYRPNTAHANFEREEADYAEVAALIQRIRDHRVSRAGN